MTRKETFIEEFLNGKEECFDPHVYCVEMSGEPEHFRYIPGFPAVEHRCAAYRNKGCYKSCAECWDQPIEETSKENAMEETYITASVPRPTVPGLAPDVPVTTNSNGGKQSATPYGFHLLPVSSIFAAAEVAAYGANKYGEDFRNRNYTKISVEDHINHAIQHLYGYLAGDKSDDHLGHAIVRAMFAYDVAKRSATKHDDQIPGQIHMKDITDDNW